jgi:triacylglycerol lipase
MSISTILFIILLLLNIIVIVYIFVQGSKYIKDVSYTLANPIRCGQNMCPISFKNTPVLPLPNELSSGFTNNTQPFFISVANFMGSFISYTSKNNKYIDLSDMKTFKLIYFPGDQNPFGILSTIDSDQNTLVLALRGTQTASDFFEDSQITQNSFQFGGNVHQGFLNVYNSIKDQITTALKTFTGTTLIITGHSLGSAVAVLMAMNIFYTFPNLNIALITFACPRIGDLAFATNTDKNIPLHFTFRNESDIVPNLPPAVSMNLKNPSTPLNYYHCGLPIVFNDNWFSVLNNHNIANYLNFLNSVNM